MKKTVHHPAYRKLLLRLKAAREAAGLRQLDVVTALGRPHQSFVSKIESGERRLDVLELIHLAKLYKKPTAYFLEGL